MTMPRRIALAAVLLAAGLLYQVSPAAAMIAMSWSLESRVDPATGDKSCLITSLGGDITARLSLDKDYTTIWSVMIGFDNQPGSVRYLRIDGEVFQNAEASFQGDVAVDIVARLITPTPGFRMDRGPQRDPARRPLRRRQLRRQGVAVRSLAVGIEHLRRRPWEVESSGPSNGSCWNSRRAWSPT